MTSRQRASLLLRVATEVGVVAALAYWGARTGDGTAAKVVLAIAAPAVGFGVWGLVDFRWAGRLAEPLRLIEELAISLVAAVACYGAGGRLLGFALGTLSVVYHAFVYATGGRLLEPAARARADRGHRVHPRAG